MAQLEPLRAMDWLTRWDTVRGKLIRRPLTIVASGAAPFSQIARSTRRDVFYDAPLNGLDGSYDRSNSYYASADMATALGRVSSRLSTVQKHLVEQQTAAAHDLGLVSRYWGTPDWPVSSRTQVWEDLQAGGAGTLNVDQVDVAARLDWRQCTVLGIPVCA
jgi:hypothetical protein